MAGLGDIITAGGPLIPAGKDELGRPLFKDIAGNLVYKGTPKAAPAATYGPVQGPPMPPVEREKTPRGRPRPNTPSRPGDPALDLAKALAGEFWRGVETPGRAARGEPVTLGDAWTTALDWGVLSPVGSAPPGAIRAGASRNKPPETTVADVMDRNYRYSPSRLAAHNLKTNKGSYEQIRAELLKNGAKPDELAWSGFDQKFGGQTKISRQEVVDYLDQYTGDITSTNVRSSSGTVGAAEDIDEVVERYIEQNLDHEAGYYRDDFLPEQLASEYEQVQDLMGDDLIDLAENLGYDDIDQFAKDYSDYWVIDDDIFPEEQAIERAYGDPVEFAENSLRDQARWMNTDELREEVGLGDAFYPGDTEYSNYFTKGGSDYQELTTVFDDPAMLGTRVSQNAGAHFDDDPLFHSRVAMFDDGQTYHLGEIQSDWAQKGRGNMTTPAEEISGSYAVYDDLVRGLATTENAAIDLGYTFPIDQSRAVLENSIMARAHGIGGPSDASRARFIQQGMETPRYVTEAVLDNTQGGAASYYDFINERVRPEYTRIDTSSASPDTFPMTRYLWANRPMPEGEGFLPGFQDGPVQAASRQFIEDQNLSLPDTLAQIGKAREIANKTPSGPYVTSTDKWVTAAVRNAMEDAVRGGQKRLTFGTGELAGDMTMMPGASGTKFYDEIVPKIAAKEAKRYGGQLGQHFIETPKGRYPVPSLELTPEFIEQVKRKGIPLFAGFPAAMSLADLVAYDQAEPQL